MGIRGDMKKVVFIHFNPSLQKPGVIPKECAKSTVAVEVLLRMDVPGCLPFRDHLLLLLRDVVQ